MKFSDFMSDKPLKYDKSFTDPRIDAYVYKEELTKRIEKLGKHATRKLLKEMDKYEKS